LFLAQFNNLNPSSLDLLQRVLLVTDGTLTDTLESAVLEPIGLKKLTSGINRASSRVEALDLDAGEPVLQREILLFGENTGANYVYAKSLLALNRFPEPLRDELIHSGKPIGRLWSEYKLESRKELLEIEYRPLDDLGAYFKASSSNLLSRRYRLISGGKPLSLINECFPCQY